MIRKKNAGAMRDDVVLIVLTVPLIAVGLPTLAAFLMHAVGAL